MAMEYENNKTKNVNKYKTIISFDFYNYFNFS